MNIFVQPTCVYLTKLYGMMFGALLLSDLIKTLYDFIRFSFIRLCMKFNNFFAFIKLFFEK